VGVTLKGENEEGFGVAARDLTSCFNFSKLLAKFFSKNNL